MNHNYHRSFDGFELIPMTADDAEKYRVLRNHLENRQCFLTSSYISDVQQRNWYQKYLERDNEIMFSLYTNEEFIGGCGIYDVSQDVAEFGRILIDSKYRNRGIGYSTLRAICDIARTELQIKELRLDVFGNNKSAISLYNRLGFETYDVSCERDREVLYMRMIL